MKRSFDTRVSMSIKTGLEMGLVQPLATSVLASTAIYLEKAAIKVPAIHNNLQQRSWAHRAFVTSLQSYEATG